MKLKPKRLNKGDTIGVVAPASPIRSRGHLHHAVKELKSWDFQVKLGEHVYRKHGYMAGTDQERADDLNAMFKDKTIDAIMVTNGGYGSGRILDLLDYNMIKQNPKLLVGFSDITSLHLALQKKTGLVTFHGPGVMKWNPQDFSSYSKEYLLKAISNNAPIGAIKVEDDKNWVDIIHPGQVQAEIVGGNLALLCASLGTPYEIDTKGKILFFEDWNLEPWMMDTYIQHLKNAGKLDDAVGFVIGECAHCDPVFHAGTGIYGSLSLEELFAELIQPFGKPAIYGLPLGHTASLATIPLGVEAYLDATNGKLVIKENGVI